MYIPRHFSFSQSSEALATETWAFIKKYNFGMITTNGPNGIVVSHLPFLVEEGQGNGTLSGHFARANRHWELVEGRESVIVFQGPHCYISPTWYVNPNVPTWNYITVHLYGQAELIDDLEEKHQLLLNLTDFNESRLPDPWVPDYDESMLHAVIGLRFHIHRIEAKQKLSQNKTIEDRKEAICALRASGSDDERRIADLMEQSLEQV